MAKDPASTVFSSINMNLLSPTRPKSHFIRRHALMVAFATLCVAPQLAKSQVVVSNPAVVTGSGSVNPGSETLGYFAGSDATLLSNLKSDSYFRAIQDYSGFTGYTANDKTYTVNFAADQDIRFTYGSANITSSAAALSNATYAISGSSSLRLQAASASTATSLTVSFGTSDGGTGFAVDQTVTGVGFTLTGNYGNAVNDTVTVTYYSIIGTALSTQTYTNSTSTSSSAGGNGPVNAFSAYLNTTGDVASNVSYLTISFTTDTAAPFIFGLDDFGFTTTAIPEPSSIALLGGAASLAFVLAVRRRTRR
jgi:hypothetical protein